MMQTEAEGTFWLLQHSCIKQYISSCINHNKSVFFFLLIKDKFRFL